MFQRINAQIPSNESMIQLALQVVQQDADLLKAIDKQLPPLLVQRVKFGS